MVENGFFYLSRERVQAYTRTKGAAGGDCVVAHSALCAESPRTKYAERRPHIAAVVTAVYRFLRQALGVNNSNIGNSSNRPANISIIKTILLNGEKNPKLQAGPA